MNLRHDPTYLCTVVQDFFTPRFTIRRDRVHDTDARKEESNFLERLFLFATVTVILMVGGRGGGNGLGCR